jgi:hypothetical protein
MVRADRREKELWRVRPGVFTGADDANLAALANLNIRRAAMIPSDGDQETSASTCVIADRESVSRGAGSPTRNPLAGPSNIIIDAR